MRDHPDRITIDKCIDGWLYRIYSRNLNLGVYREHDKGFVGIRQKFGHRFLFAEYHWDTGEPFGTANPLEAICECPIKDLREYLTSDPTNKTLENNQVLFDWIEQKGRELGITPESC
ncbi:hypothetical protein SH449x_002768 [Pirellulaceae bacterium SH449]